MLYKVSKPKDLCQEIPDSKTVQNVIDLFETFA